MAQLTQRELDSESIIKKYPCKCTTKANAADQITDKEKIIHYRLKTGMLFAGSENRSVKALVTITFGQNLSFQSSSADTGQTLDSNMNRPL